MTVVSADSASQPAPSGPIGRFYGFRTELLEVRCSRSRDRRLGRDRRVGELEFLTARGADRIVELQDSPAPWALSPQLAIVPAIADGREEPKERNGRRDQEPEQKRTALDAADDSAGKAEEEQNYDQAHVRHGPGVTTRAS